MLASARGSMQASTPTSLSLIHICKSAKGRVYYGCSNYPKCNYMTWDEPVPEKCPQCGSTLFKKKGQLYCAKEGCGFVKAIEKK